jgi:16S rRNA C1402 (ribose-2'-O) methylase RsmI
MDTPYRLKKIASELRELSQHRDRKVFIAMNLTLDNEKIYWGPSSKVPEFEKKEEFVLVIEALP